MIKAEQIPGEVVEALKDAANQWAMWLTDEEVRAALASGLAAWPGAHTSMKAKLVHPGGFAPMKYIGLPLKETPDGK
jgi:hypothetical protein